MDINDLRVIVMLFGLVLFLAIWAWSWSGKRREAFDEAARLPFADDESGLEAMSPPGRPKTTTPLRGAGTAGALGVTQGEKR